MPHPLPRPGDTPRAAGITPTAPGHILFRLITARQLDVSEAADHMGLAPDHLEAIIQGSQKIDAESARVISAFTSTSARLWTNMQAAASGPDLPYSPEGAHP